MAISVLLVDEEEAFVQVTRPLRVIAPRLHGTLMGHFVTTIHIVNIDHHILGISEAALNQKFLCCSRW